MDVSAFITYECDCACTYCNVDKYNKYIDFNVYKLLLELQSGIKSICLLGGEPTLHPQYNNIVYYNRKNNIYTTVITNATNVDKALKADSIIVSVDGIDQYNSSVRKNQKMTNVIDLISTALSMDKNISINKVVDVNEYSTGFLRQNIDFVKSFNIPVTYILSNDPRWTFDALTQTQDILKSCDIRLKRYSKFCFNDVMYMTYSNLINSWILERCHIEDEFLSVNDRCNDCVFKNDCLSCKRHCKFNYDTDVLRCWFRRMELPKI